MICFEDAYNQMMGVVSPLPAETVDLPHALFRVLAADVTADRPMPPFDRSAMDGFACRRADTAQPLTLEGTVAAGQDPGQPLAPGQCRRVMTGAPVPANADLVVPVEDAEEVDGRQVRVRRVPDRPHIARCGEDWRAGDVILGAGTRLLAPHLALLASVGALQLRVARRPRVGLIATGSEVVEPSKTPGAEQIRNTNTILATAQLAALAITPTYYGIARDHAPDIDALVRQAAGENDVVLVSGGVSMGDFDLVPQSVQEAGFEILFHHVAIKPGKPVLFGRLGPRYAFGLPGNPVSTFVILELLVKPFLARLMGHKERPGLALARMAAPFARRDAERAEWQPVVVDDTGAAQLIPYHGSGHLRALAQANALLCIPRGTTELPKDTLVHVRLLWP